MKYKDYYQALGVERTATAQDIKKAYRKLAHKFHPDISKDPKGEEKFKEIAEAYSTLKNPEKRQEYDNLGQRPPGQTFTPPHDWSQRHADDDASFEDVDISDFLDAFRSAGDARVGQRHANHPMRGEDYSVNVPVPMESIYSGGEIDVTVEIPEYDPGHQLPRRVSRTFRITVPKGATEGQRLRLGGKGGPGRHSGIPGDLYVVLAITPHPRYRLSGRDLFFDLSLAPWEAALGAAIEISTLGGKVQLKVKPGTSSGERLRLSKRGLPSPDGGAGDLYALIRIVVPKNLSDVERKLYEQLEATSNTKVREQEEKEKE
jgi:curved DNA-binding protein